MGFMRALGKLTQAAVDVAVTPVEMIKDAATLGGELTDRSQSYTRERLERAAENAADAYDALDED